jgi:ABC-type multidrug transport system ATPase subunit
MGAAISTSDLVVRYGDTTALDGVSLEVAAGTLLGVLGPNGAGKTTLVRVLATQQTPTAGRAAVAGYDVVANRREAQRRIGVTGQYAALDDDLTTTENLHLVAALAGMSRPAASARVSQLREQLDLPDDRARLGQLSGGTRRRVDLAAGLLTEPAVVVLDEPTTGLDPRSRTQLWGVVSALRDHGVTVLLTTQYLEEADRLADRVVFLDQGRIVADGTPGEVKARIGGQVLTATLASAVDVARTEARLLALGASVEADAPTRRIVARTGGATDAARLVAALDELGVAIDELELTTASLDDAFHEMTSA